MPPPNFRAKPSGPFPLRGGPLCGLFTDQLPRAGRGSIGLIYDASHLKSGHEWMCIYRFVPDWPGYVFRGARQITAGE